jgi:glycerophosphoryl diester phosphodiesterase
MAVLFDLQGHRGSRGLKPENTLPSFEVAFDLGVTSVETDVHLTRNGVPVLAHDAVVSDRLCKLLPGSHSPEPRSRPLVSHLTLQDLRGYAADRNPDPLRFPEQDPSPTPLAALFAARHHVDPYTPPALADLFAFAKAYAGELGAATGKSAAQQARARQVRFDLELKRVPFRPEYIGDESDALLERRVIEVVRAAGMLGRTNVRGFDHRCVLALRRLEPGLSTAVLVTGTAPVSPAEVARQAGASTYCPQYEFIDGPLVQQVHDAGLRVIPWTINDPENWGRLLDWGVDGITTDFPDRLAAYLGTRGVPF